MAGIDEIAMLDAIENIERNEEAGVHRPRIESEDPFLLSDKQFVATFRLTKDLVHALIALIQPYMAHPSRHSALSIQKKVLIALRFFATGSYQSDTGYNVYVGVSQASVSRSVKEVVEALNVPDIMNTWIRFPRIIGELENLRQEFYNNTGFPGAIGCIDCTHVAIVAPPANDEEFPEHIYVNRKRYHSINVQLICDSHLKIMHINSRYPGSTHDAYIWRNSNASEVMQNIYRHYNDRSFYLLGDSGYPLRPWLLTPLQIEPEAGTPESRYNIHHRRARTTIERCNGVLKSRFRCLLKHRVLHYIPTVASRIINACAVLHNMCIGHAVEFAVQPEELNEGMWEIIQHHADDEQEPLNRVNPDLAAGRRLQQQLILNYFA